MAKSQYQTSTTDWNKRIAKYQSAGIPATVWAPIASQDLNRTYQTGSTGMTNSEADVAIYSAWKGSSAVQKSPAHRSGLWGDIETVATNIIPDASKIITSLPRGVFDLGKELVTPSTYTKTAADIGSALHDFSDPGKSFRDLAQSPLLDLIPGVADVAALSTSAGRQSLLEHPVTAALDVLPYTKGLGKAAGIARGIPSAEEAAQAATEARAAGLEPPTPPTAAAASLRAGKPFRAAGQAVDVRWLGGRAGQLSQKALEKVKLDEKNRQFNTLLNQTHIQALGRSKKYSRRDLDHIFKELGDDPAAMQAFTEKARLGDTASMSPEELTVLDKVDTERARLQNEIYYKRKDLINTEFGDYPADHPVIAATKARDSAAAVHEENAVKVIEAQGKWDAAVKIQQREALEARNKIIALQLLRQRKGIRGGYKPPRVITRTEIKKITRFLNMANREAERMANRLADSKAAMKESGKELRKAADKVTKEVVKSPPAYAHPLIHQMFRDLIAKAIDPNNPIIENAARNLAISTYNEIIKNVYNTHYLDRLQDYVGKAEYERLWSDSVKETLKLIDQGLEPRFMHVVKPEDVESINSMHIPKQRDIKESQVRTKAAKSTSSVLSMRVGLTAEMNNIVRRDSMQNVYDSFLTHHTQTGGQLEPVFSKAAQDAAAAGKHRGMDMPTLQQYLLEKEWTRFDFAQYGLVRPGGVSQLDDIYIPKSLADNLEKSEFGPSGAIKSGTITGSRPYQVATQIFRTSVLYGPRHFAHVVIGGIMPILLDDPLAIQHFPQLWDMFKTLSRGEVFTGKVGNIEIPPTITTHFNYKIDGGYKILQTKVGNKYAQLAQDYWLKSGAKVGEKLENIENAAQSMYQASIYLRDIKKGTDPMLALEHARRVVVNMDGMAPFERTIFKQIFPFYTFTRFATKFLVQLPFDHPLRVAVLSQLSNQAQEEWGTGLPQTMMSLFFIGTPDHNGNSWAVDMRNMNPFRSVASSFTLAGFLSSLNPVLQAPFAAAGFDTLSGSGQLYPQLTFDPNSGNLVVEHPKGGPMTAAESFIPELGGIDALLGISDNLRSLKANDKGAFDRQLMNMFNIPFRPSVYNIPKVRGRLAENAYKGSEAAVTQYKKTGDFEGTIGRYNLIPYQGRMWTPAAFQQYWEKLTGAYKQAGYGGYVGAALPKPPTSTANILAELEQYYGG